MAQENPIEALDRVKQVVLDTATGYSRRLKDLRYCDIRVEASETRAAAAENGQEKASSQDYHLSLGIRVVAGDTAATGYFGQLLGGLEELPRALREGVRHAHRRALANAERKFLARSAFGPLGDSLHPTLLSPVPVRQDVVPARFQKDPRSIPLPTVLEMARETSRRVSALSPRVLFNFVGMATLLTRQLFSSSEGASIDQAFAITEGTVLVVAQGQYGPLELYDYMGHQGGWEVAEEGVDTQNIHFPPFPTFALNLARDTLEVAQAPPLKPPDEEVVVVTDPHFNALLVHEVVGHPVELDRALKMETAYAGRSWFLKNAAESQRGKEVASPLVSAFSDPTMEGLGHYLYDDEGTPARRVYHIERGVFKEFLNSRQTAAILGVEPNGSYKATDASLVPLIRMSNTAFAPGNQDPQEIIKEVERGYYLQGHRIPSVAESRENFRISAMKVYEIRNGELGQLYRDGGIMADTRDFFMRVDAVGHDFRLFAIPNCGKGQPMQTKRMGNGGPTMRSVARMTGA